MRQSNTRAMVETGFLTAIIVVLTIIGSNVPMLGFLATIVGPATLAVVGVRWGSKYSCSAAVGTFFLLSFIYGPLMALLETVTFSLMGICIGEGYRAQWNGVKKILIPASAFVVAAILVFFISYVVMNVDYMSLYTQFETEFNTSLRETYSQQDMDAAQQLAIQQQVESSLTFMKYAFATMVFFSASVITFMTSKLAAIILRRVGMSVEELPPCGKWQMPKWAPFLLAIGIILNYWANVKGIEIAMWIGPNLVLAGAVLCAIQGVACVWSIFESYRVGKSWRTIVLAVLLLMFPQTIVVLGIIDSIFDLRRHFSERSNQTKY